MARTSRNLGFTVPPRMADEFARIAEEEGSTKSELFRSMFRLYQTYRSPLKSQQPDAWAERLIAEAQQAERQRPLSSKELRGELEQAQGYGAERAHALGITSEQEFGDILHDAERIRQ